jgi:hypothetical protein
LWQLGPRLGKSLKRLNRSIIFRLVTVSLCFFRFV